MCTAGGGGDGGGGDGSGGRLLCEGGERLLHEGGGGDGGGDAEGGDGGGVAGGGGMGCVRLLGWGVRMAAMAVSSDCCRRVRQLAQLRLEPPKQSGISAMVSSGWSAAYAAAAMAAWVEDSGRTNSWA